MAVLIPYILRLCNDPVTDNILILSAICFELLQPGREEWILWQRLILIGEIVVQVCTAGIELYTL